MAESHLSNEQITELKNALFASKESLEETIKVLEDQDPFKDPSYILDNAAIDTDVREQLGHETVEAEVKALNRKLQKVNAAIKRTQDGTYGRDIKTNEPIPFERLQVVPEAEYTVATEKKLVK